MNASQLVLAADFVQEIKEIVHKWKGHVFFHTVNTIEQQQGYDPEAAVGHSVRIVESFLLRVVQYEEEEYFFEMPNIPDIMLQSPIDKSTLDFYREAIYNRLKDAPTEEQWKESKYYEQSKFTGVADIIDAF